MFGRRVSVEEDRAESPKRFPWVCGFSTKKLGWSYGGRVLVADKLLQPTLWHSLIALKPMNEDIQGAIVDFVLSGKHWIGPAE